MSEDVASHINASLSKRLAQERVLRGVSKKRLAGMAGFTPSTVRFIEDPSENPTIYNLVRYAVALDIDVGKLLSECLEPHLGKAKQAAPAKKPRK